ncbi:hypothetical protein [Yersinia intermedia]|uniref:hypothetical protein n=1 Tax=Yersinia intermedia TaxID=631 RepID=UPI0012D7B096|nr:hypothetical protein [Yersinia intermedia]
MQQVWILVRLHPAARRVRRDTVYPHTRGSTSGTRRTTVYHALPPREITVIKGAVTTLVAICSSSFPACLMLKLTPKT